MSDSLKLFKYIYIDNKTEKTLFLLHGTGGSENDFLFLDEMLGKKFNLVGLKGNVDEDGMNRFFRRLEVGVFDQESIKKETDNLKLFIETWKTIYTLKTENMYVFGYSNGANMLLATLFKHPELFRNLLLLHPMLPYGIEKGSLDLSSHTIFLSLGLYDQMISQNESHQVVEILKSCKAKVELKEYPSGHEISHKEIEDVVAFLTS